MCELTIIRRSQMTQSNLLTDAIDANIITALSEDSRRSYADVGVKVGLSTAAVHERVRKLQERGVIERFGLRLDAARLGLHFTAFVAIRNERAQHCADVASRLGELPEVLELHSVAGEFDFVAKVRTTHASAFEAVLFRIKSVQGVATTTSTVVLSSHFEERTPPIFATN